MLVKPIGMVTFFRRLAIKFNADDKQRLAYPGYAPTPCISTQTEKKNTESINDMRIIQILLTAQKLNQVEASQD